MQKILISFVILLTASVGVTAEDAFKGPLTICSIETHLAQAAVDGSRGCADYAQKKQAFEQLTQQSGDALKAAESAPEAVKELTTARESCKDVRESVKTEMKSLLDQKTADSTSKVWVSKNKLYIPILAADSASKPSACAPEASIPADSNELFFNFTQGQSCNDGSQCNGGETCRNHICEPGNSCWRDADCPWQQHCMNGSCWLGNGGFCTSDFDCRFGDHCINGLCQGPI